MPIYYFHVDGDLDDYGTELPNVAEARRQALKHWAASSEMAAVKRFGKATQ
jgi:hypothetical protein